MCLVSPYVPLAAPGKAVLPVSTASQHRQLLRSVVIASQYRQLLLSVITASHYRQSVLSVSTVSYYRQLLRKLLRKLLPPVSTAWWKIASGFIQTGWKPVGLFWPLLSTEGLIRISLFHTY